MLALNRFASLTVALNNNLPFGTKRCLWQEKRRIRVHVNHGLMRKGESEQVVDVFKNQMDANLAYVDAADCFLGKLVDVEEPEAKRKIIGAEFIRVFEEGARKVGKTVEPPDGDWRA